MNEESKNKPFIKNRDRSFSVAIFKREEVNLKGDGQLLRECDNKLKILRTVSLSIASVEAIEECDEILTKINEVLK